MATAKSGSIATGAIGVVLTATAGFADAVSYLRFGKFGANMTGNTVLFGIALTRHDLSGALGVLMPIASFFLGCVVAQAILDRGSRRIAFALEAAALAAASFLAGHPVQLAFVAVAMGLQNTSLGTFGEIQANTSFITGDYERLARSVVRLFDRTDGAKARGTIAVIAPMIACYALGAAAAALLVRAKVAHALLGVVAAIVVVAVVAPRADR